MPEGVSPAEVGKEIAEHNKHTEGESDQHDDRWLPILEAVLLSLVAVLAAYSGSAAKWSTESSGYRPAFNASLATDAAHNPTAPPVPAESGRA